MARPAESPAASTDMEKPMSAPGSEPSLYQHSFWHKDMAVHRKSLIGTLILPLIYTSISMWICLSLFWGSLLENNNLSKLKVEFVNLDKGGFVGDTLFQEVQAAAAKQTNRFQWNFDSSSQSDADSRQLVLDEAVWAVLQVSPNASGALTSALRTGTPSYNPLGAVTLYYTSARNQITVNSHVVSSTLALISPLLSGLAVNNTASFIGSNVHNATALITALHCPQCLASPFVLNQIDLRPFNSAPATGSVMVGLIFLLTFTFSTFQILRVVALTGLGAQLKLRSALQFRTAASLVSYLILSLWYTLINLAFQVPVEAVFGPRGFMIYWMLNFCTMAAVGLPMESLFTLIGLKWSGYFLSFWIIVNVSGGFTSFELEPTFYKYGYAFPFYHAIQGTRTILFDTRSHLGTNFGVLVAWMVAGLLGMYIFTWIRIRENKRAGAHIVL